MDRFELSANRFVVRYSIPRSDIHILRLVIRAGLEPSITALKGLCPDHLDERTVCGDAYGNRTRIFSLRG